MTTTPAETMRAAAELLREAASHATPGPWRTHDTHLGGVGGHTATVLTDRPDINDTELIAWVPTMSPEPWDETRNAWRNAGWMALMDPAVGLALADWLEASAAYYTPGVAHPTHVVHALAVARQVLGTVTGCPECGDTGACNGGPCPLGTVTEPLTEEQIVREHVTTVHLMGEQLATVESWLWERLADVRDAASAAEAQQPAPAVTEALTDCATEYRVPVPENGGEQLLVRRQSVAQGVGWAVSVMARGGGRAWTTEGWQESISALSVDRLFCWPDARTAVDEARRALTAPAATEEPTP